MKSLLHVVTRPADALAQGVMDATRSDPTLTVEIVDLNLENPDYAALVERIFAVDAIATW
ncbi:MAG: hypothetical protein DVB31_03305 [Verrucomicrobia bacterium]|nr:MAG: hypothetical protein DVB31_03305 [Verrucomicrobiota bacterium]